MGALTDQEILEALPAESRRKIDSAFEALSQSQPGDKERVILYRIAHTLKLNPTDTHFSVMAAMHYYLQLYQMIPDKIVKAGGSAMAGHLNSLKAQADLVVAESKVELIEMVRKSIGTTVAAEVNTAALRISTEKAAAEKNKVFLLASLSMIACAFIFGGTGYAIRMITDEVIMRQEHERASSAIAAAQQAARDEIEFARNSSGWLGTSDGRLAKIFFDSGAGQIAATCSSPAWEIVKAADGKYCVPKRRDLIGGDSNKYGWKIP